MAAASAPTSATAPTEHDCLAGFEEALQKESRKATFTCAGRLPINLNPNLTPSGDLTPRTDLKVHEQTLSTKPIRIRWGANGAGKTLSLPLQDPSDEGLLQDLIAACHPATSGRGGQDILDPTYRRAGALRPADFMTDFCPYESGILDILYKLNVYSGPGEVFRPHVDTPRNATQIGSLVVCLPVAFSGGELVVRHQGQEIIHDWGRINNNNANIIAPAAAAAAAEPPAINWTAFYSDCAHEVLPLHTGHRLTLTYNLFLSHGTGLSTFPISSPIV
ncbi:hypothetical protein BTJ68_05211 [Hortaea werneckii EXF-2000]|uniref:Fe2OG dioxygenase domain-containing protein n=1 Tax=Hortaea werneckii EXF-2000 TaxID=1157616 RepID=A0A1Z5TGE1_HORWE|nr:hypothetical protein BTJ68_05211 [Hortaea werneckii EXF-2000]